MQGYHATTPINRERIERLGRLIADLDRYIAVHKKSLRSKLPRLTGTQIEEAGRTIAKYEAKRLIYAKAVSLLESNTVDVYHALADSAYNASQTDALSVVLQIIRNTEESHV